MTERIFAQDFECRASVIARRLKFRGHDEIGGRAMSGACLEAGLFGAVLTLLDFGAKLGI